MKLTAYEIHKNANFKRYLRPSSSTRDWMDNSTNQFAYRCLPLTIANTYGWDILNSSAIEAVWDGGNTREAVKITGTDSNSPLSAHSHFGNGILTFAFPVIFSTEPGWDLMVAGPINSIKDGIVPLGGIVETDWLPFTFTMNWKFTRPSQRVVFAHKEPVCQLFPVKRGALESFNPRIESISNNTELEAKYKEWSSSRSDFITGLEKGDEAIIKKKYQKFYHKSTDSNGEKMESINHKTKLVLKPFERDIT